MIRSRPWSLSCGALLGALLAVGPARAEFLVDDVEVCPRSAGVLDLEFDPTARRMAFVDLAQRLRVVDLGADGLSLSPGCRGRVVDTGAVSAMPGVPLRNGPEWGLSQRGVELFYTKIGAAGVPSLARAWPEGRRWRTEALAQGEQRGLALASVDVLDPQPRLLYAGMHPAGFPLILWRESTDPASEAFFPASGNPETGGAPRWIPGQRALTAVRMDRAGVRQALRYELDAGAFESLTDGPGDKDEVWMWPAPEFGGESVFITVTDGCCLDVHRRIDGTWQRIHRIEASAFSRWPRIFSPEPFVHQGRSYVAMQLSRSKLDISDIWIAAIDPAAPLLRQVSDPATSKVRGEPEWLALPSGVFVYYSTFDALQRTTIRRAATGL